MFDDRLVNDLRLVFADPNSVNGQNKRQLAEQKLPKSALLKKLNNNWRCKAITNKKSQEFHLFYVVGDEEIQIESHDKKRNKDILKLAASVPDAVTFFDADDAPFYLRAAVKAENVNLRFKPALSENARRIRAENGRKNAANLRNSNLSKFKTKEVNL